MRLDIPLITAGANELKLKKDDRIEITSPFIDRENGGYHFVTECFVCRTHGDERRKDKWLEYDKLQKFAAFIGPDYSIKVRSDYHGYIFLEIKPREDEA